MATLQPASFTKTQQHSWWGPITDMRSGGDHCRETGSMGALRMDSNLCPADKQLPQCR